MKSGLRSVGIVPELIRCGARTVETANRHASSNGVVTGVGRVPEWGRTGAGMVPEWYRNGARTGEASESYPAWNSGRNGAGMVPEWYRNGARTGEASESYPAWNSARNGGGMVPESCRNGGGKLSAW